MFVASSLIAPTTIFHSQLKYGLYPIFATAKVYIGSDDTNEPTYASCFCKVAASFYPQFYSGQLSILMSLAAPEPGIGITDLHRFIFSVRLHRRSPILSNSSFVIIIPNFRDESQKSFWNGFTSDRNSRLAQLYFKFALIKL